MEVKVSSYEDEFQMMLTGLERLDMGKTTQENFLKMLDAILDRVRMVRERELQQLDSGSLKEQEISYHGLRLLILLIVQIFKAVTPVHRRAFEILQKEAERMFVDILINSCVGFQELIYLGEVICLLTTQVSRNGEGVLDGCSLDLPLTKLDNIQLKPAKVTLRLNDVNHLYAIQSLWIGALCIIIPSNPQPLQLAIFNKPLCHQISSCCDPRLNIPYITIHRLCKALVQRSNIGEDPDLQTKHNSIEGLLSCVQECLIKALSGIRRAQEKSGFLAPEGDNSIHVITSTISSIFDALESLLHSGSTGLYLHHTASFVKLLGTHIIPHRAELLGTLHSPNKVKAGKDKSNASDASNTELNKYLLCFIATHMLSSLRKAIQVDRRFCPSVHFLTQCCVDVQTHAAAISCLLVAIQGDSFTASVLLQWAEENLRQSSAAETLGSVTASKSSKKTSFAPSVAQDSIHIESQAKRRRTKSAAETPTPRRVESLQMTATQHSTSLSKERSMKHTDFTEVCSVLSELQGLYFILQALTSSVSVGSITADMAMKKYIIACFLHEALCAARFVVGKGEFDLTGDCGTIASTVHSTYLSAHNEVVAAYTPDPKTDTVDHESVENPRKKAKGLSIRTTSGSSFSLSVAIECESFSHRHCYLWATVHSLCRVLAMISIPSSEPDSPLLSLLTIAIDVALPLSLHHCIERETAQAHSALTATGLLPHMLASQSWLRDVFYKQCAKSSTRWLTKHVNSSALLSVRDLSKNLSRAFAAFEQCVLCDDYSSLCLYLSTFPITKTIDGNQTHSFLFLSNAHLTSLEECQRYYMLAFAAKKVQYIIAAKLSDQSASAQPLEHSMLLVRDFFSLTTRTIETPVGQNMDKVKDVFAIKNLFESLANVTMSVAAVLLKSFAHEQAALKKCAPHSIPLKSALSRDPTSSGGIPVSSLVNIQLLKQADVWIRASGIRIGSNSWSEREIPSTYTQDVPSSTSTHKSVFLAKIIFSGLVQLWGSSLKSKIAFIVKVAEDIAGSGTAMSTGGISETDKMDEDEAQQNRERSNGEKYWTWQAVVGCAVLDFLVQFRSALNAVRICLCKDDRENTKHKTALDKISNDIDNKVNYLIHSGAVDLHPIQARLSQLVTLSMLDQSFKDGPLDPEDYSQPKLSSKDRDIQATKLGSEIVDAQIAGRFGALLDDLPTTSVVRSQRYAPGDLPCTIQEKRQNDRLGLALAAFSSFVMHSILLNPAASIWALSSIFSLWAEHDRSSRVYRMCFEELSYIAGKKLMQYLIVSNAELAIDWIVLPLILRDRCIENNLAILHTLTVTMFGWNPVKTSGSGQDPKPSGDFDGKTKPQKPDALPPDKYVEFTYDSIMSGVVSCRNEALTQTVRLKMLNASMDAITTINSYLIDDSAVGPHLLYRILISTAVQEMDEKELIAGGLFKYLEACARQLQVQVTSKSKGDGSLDDEILHKSTAQHTNLYLFWDLGGPDRKREAALKGLKIMATIINAKEWNALSKNPKIKPDALAAELSENLSILISTDFLYIMANLLQPSGWSKETQRQQEQSVRALRCLISLMKQSDLTKFLPKIMILLDDVLGSDSQRVRHAGVELTAELCNRLPHDVLCDNLSAIVVALFHIVESGSPIVVQSDGREKDAVWTGLAYADLRRLGVMWPRFQKNPPEASILERNNSIGIGKDMVCILEAAYATELGHSWTDKARSAAIQIIKTLFLSRRRDISKGIQSVACIPSIPELESVRLFHVQEQLALGLNDTLKLLIKMLKHDTVHVRAMALRRLLDVCREHKHDIYDIVTSSALNAAYDVGSGRQDIVSLLLQELLMLSSREAEDSVMVACGKCLGELGAIDPANVQVDVLIASKQVGANLVTISGTFSIKISLEADLNCHPPWEVSAVQMGMVLLEHHLVPGMKSSPSGQDHTGFAIQEILGILWKELQALPNQMVPKKGQLSVTSKGSEKLDCDERAKVNAPMPGLLADLLQQRSIHEVTDPYWNSKYRFQGLDHVSSPVYKTNMSFSLWLSKWLKQLLVSSNGRNHDLFDACRGTLKNRSALSQFILPSVLVGNLTHPVYKETDLAGGSATDAAHNALLLEICHVLSGGETGSEIDYSTKLASIAPDPMAVQAIFSLLDTLSAWSSKGLAARLQQRNSHSSSSTSSTTNQTHDNVVDEDIQNLAQKTGSSIRKLIDAVPKMLLCSAALSIKAYARALRYLELHLRQLHWAEKAKATLNRGGNLSVNSLASAGMGEVFGDMITRTIHDGSNGELPPLAATHVDTLMQIFSKLEDPDALQGLLFLTQKHGHKPSSVNRILELEQTDDWLGALLEYGLVQSVAHLTNGASEGISSVVSAQENVKYKEIVPSATTAGPLTASKQHSSVSKDTSDGLGLGIATHVDDSDYLLEIGKHERGRLRCLIELGHLDAVMDQTLGTIQRMPSLEPILLPLSIEASWRLMQWPNLSSLLERAEKIEYDQVEMLQILPEDQFSISIGKSIQHMRKHQETEFQDELTEARRRTMQALSAASMESYRRAYPLLARLQVLQELEEGYQLFNTQGKDAADTESKRIELLSKKWFWDARLAAMSPSIAQQSFILAVRRTLLSAAALPHLVAQNWLGLATRLGGLGRYEAARIALRYSVQSGLDPQESVLHESRLLKEAGQVHKALMLLEPVEPDCHRIRWLLRQRQILVLSELPAALVQGSAELSACLEFASYQNLVVPEFLTCKEKKLAFAERLLLGTQLMIESRAKHGQQVIERYKCLSDLNPKWELAHFHFARYYEYLYHDMKRKEVEDAQSSSPRNSNARHPIALKGAARPQDKSADDNHQIMCQYLVNALKEYCKCISYGMQMLMQALPRMLTLWFSFTSPDTRTVAGSAASESEKAKIEFIFKAKGEAAAVLKKFQERIPASTWFTCMPQLVSRTGHRHPDTLEIIKSIILKVLVSYPQQGVWHIAGLIHSILPTRKEIGERLISEAYQELKRRPDSGGLVAASRIESADMLRDSRKLFLNLVELAAHQHKEKRLRWSWPQGLDYKRFLVPNQHVLARVKQEFSSSRGAGDTAYTNESQTFQYIQTFSENVDVAASKAKPKTIFLTTTNGAAVKFLCKQEKNGDLRKDARMMEFNTVINRLLQHDLEGRRRNLRLRTYAVVCLNEECGILEWVGNTACIRHLITQAHSYYPQDFPMVQSKEIYHPFLEMQEKYQDDMGGLVREYRSVVLNNYRPCFHRWFIETFSDPTEWLEARVTFTRSCAVWAAVGHVIGLGDRHTENVLVDVTNGECVHVDFDCLFDKGLQLARPEIVPFRLTPNIVDAMGLSGVEGTFRRTMEVCFSLLRENKETLLSVLEPFLRDPTVAWGRGGRAQRPDMQASTTSKTDKERQGNCGKGDVQVDSENPEAKEALEKITGRLNGIYNLTNPAADRIMRKYEQRSKAEKKELHLPMFGMGAGRDEAHSLSVQGQVARLIDEAKAEENLAQMYVGWQPWS